MPDERRDRAPSERATCPLCQGDRELSHTFCWVISPPIFSLLLSGWKRLYVELPCCSECLADIRRRRWLVRTLLFVIPTLVVAAFWVKFQWFPHIREVKFAIALTGVVFSLVIAAFARSGLDRVRVRDARLIEQGQQISKTRLRNSTPWFLPSLSPYGAERVELAEEAQDSAK